MSKKPTAFGLLLCRSGLSQLQFSEMHRLHTGRGYSPYTISKWVTGATALPPPSALLVLMLVCGDITVEELRKFLDEPSA